MAQFLGLSTAAFTKKFCQQLHGAWHLTERPDNPDCLFLKNKRCSVYEARPTQCRTWPFWPELMQAKAWKKEVIDFCPGVNKGKVVPAQEIAERLSEQTSAEKELIKVVPKF